MSQVSKYPISKTVADRIFELLLESITTVNNIEEAEKYLSDLLSPTEKIMVAKRVAIAYLLSKRYQYREVSKILRVSLTTVASVNLSLRYGTGGYNRILSRVEKSEQLEAFFQTIIEKVLAAPAASASKGGGVWRYLHEEVKQAKKKRKNAF